MTLRGFLAAGLAGVLAGLVCVAALLWADVANLWTMIRTTETPWVPVFILCTSFAVTFGSAAIGTAVMTIPEDG